MDKYHSFYLCTKDTLAVRLAHEIEHIINKDTYWKMAPFYGGREISVLFDEYRLTLTFTLKETKIFITKICYLDESYKEHLYNSIRLD